MTPVSTATNASPAAPRPVPPAAGLPPTRPGDFGHALERARSERAGPAAKSEIRAAAERFVSTALITPILAQARQTNGAAEPFAPGPADKHFGPLLDTELADRVTSAAKFDLVDAVVARLGGNQ